MLLDKNGNRKYLNKKERWAFFEAVESSGLPQDVRLFCLVVFYTGCRISEALRLTPERIDRTERVVVFETLKRRKKGVFRQVHIPEPLAAALHVYSSCKPPEQPIWPMSRSTGYRHIKSIMKKIGLSGSKASPKGLRHAFAISCVLENVPVTTVQKWLGHADLNTTAIYLECVGKEERKQAQRTWSKA